jgi:hypothetical protein
MRKFHHTTTEKYIPMIRISRWLLAIVLTYCTSAGHAQSQAMKTITDEERKQAIELLTGTRSDVANAIKSLSHVQLNYKMAADKWSVAECVKHIAAAETTLRAMVDSSLKQPANPEARAGIKMSDQELIAAVEDRSHRSKTFAALEPANSPYATVDEALKAFDKNREKLISFIKDTQVDLRNQVSVLPIGTYDAYQFILLIAAHTNRHTQQIAEVKASASFPKK